MPLPLTSSLKRWIIASFFVSLQIVSNFVDSLNLFHVPIPSPAPKVSCLSLRLSSFFLFHLDWKASYFSFVVRSNMRFIANEMPTHQR